MYLKKLRLSELKVKSFVTLPEVESKKVIGGTNTDPIYVDSCQLDCSAFCTNNTRCCVYETQYCTQIKCNSEAYTCTCPGSPTEWNTCDAACQTISPNVGCV
jgi:hypothetical protein